MVKHKPRPTPEERAKNVAMGLTPLGRVPKGPGPGFKKHQVPDRKNGVDTRVRYSIDDYRHNGLRFTPARKAAYLESLATHGEPVLARVEVGISKRTEDRHRTEDPEFRDAMDEALRRYGAVLSKEIHRRGVEGVQEAVYGNVGGGTTGVVGWVTRYSDRLLLTQAMRFEPGYTPKSKVEHSGSVRAEAIGLEDLSPESQEDLKRILEREMARRATNGDESMP